jgi:hypothetical protein
MAARSASMASGGVTFIREKSVAVKAMDEAAIGGLSTMEKARAWASDPEKVAARRASKGDFAPGVAMHDALGADQQRRADREAGKFRPFRSDAKENELRSDAEDNFRKADSYKSGMHSGGSNGGTGTSGGEGQAGSGSAKGRSFGTPKPPRTPKASDSNISGSIGS